jgi:hypothetical protein
MAANVMAYHHINGALNPADILSKHCGYQQVWSLLQPFMFWQGDTMKLMELQKLGRGKQSDRVEH